MNTAPDDYDAYLGLVYMAQAAGIDMQPMSEVEFIEACESKGYAHPSLIDMDLFEESYRRS